MWLSHIITCLQSGVRGCANLCKFFFSHLSSFFVRVCSSSELFFYRLPSSGVAPIVFLKVVFYRTNKICFHNLFLVVWPENLLFLQKLQHSSSFFGWCSEHLFSGFPPIEWNIFFFGRRPCHWLTHSAILVHSEREKKNPIVYKLNRDGYAKYQAPNTREQIWIISWNNDDPIWKCPNVRSRIFSNGKIKWKYSEPTVFIFYIIILFLVLWYYF